MARNKENCLISAALKQDVQHSLKNQTNMIFSEGKSGSIMCNPSVGKKESRVSQKYMNSSRSIDSKMDLRIGRFNVTP